MLASTNSFMDALEKWVLALRANDFVAAKQHARHLTLSGELLVIHPEFVKCFHLHADGFEPNETLFHMCQFLQCATDVRARQLS